MFGGECHHQIGILLVEISDQFRGQTQPKARQTAEAHFGSGIAGQVIGEQAQVIEIMINILSFFKQHQRFATGQQLAAYPLKKFKPQLLLGVFSALLAAG